MKKKGWVWYVILGMFYLCLGGIALSFYQEATHINLLHGEEEIVAEFEGNDWVQWKDTPEGVIADQVHPLPGYKPLDKRRIQEGDRLLKLDGNPITKAEVVDQITAAARPAHVFLISLASKDPYTLTINVEEGAIIINGFRLSFGFNDYALYWHLSGWVMGIGAFVALIILAILLPFVRKSWREYLTLLGIAGTALSFFLVQLIRHIYLIVESDLVYVGVEKRFILVYLTLLFLYAGYYLYFKSNFPNALFLLPSLLLGGYLLYTSYDIIFLSQQLTFYHDLIERYAALFFLIHLTGALFLFIVGSWENRSESHFIWLIAIIALCSAGIWYYAQATPPEWLHPEHVQFVCQLLLFFPLINATFLQLKFGRASLVITQSLQYLVAFFMSVILFLLIIQLFDYLRPSIQYRRLLEFVTFLILLLIIRLVYQANENKLSRYFVSSQQERLTKFKTFIASIPRYTSVANLRYDLIDQLNDYFNAENVHLWWKESSPEESGTLENKTQEDIYRALDEQHTVWSKTKEISPLRLGEEQEKQLQLSPYTLVCPITVDEENYALLMLGKKKRGVYNLLDLELISQLIQQTQLTLNVLQLVNREKELIQQTYEANLTALRSQINPHFLFNTLNCIGELVHESADLAEQATEKLAFIFRYTLNKSNQQFVPLSEEMKLITTYLDLEKIRFGDRLTIKIDIDSDVKEVPIPAFVLSTLVENCIKHGISKILHSGVVSVKAFKEGEYLVCEVVDNGPGIDLSRIYKSHGLSSSISRMENIYDLKNLLYFENTGDGTYVRMRIPLVKHPQLAE